MNVTFETKHKEKYAKQLVDSWNTCLKLTDTSEEIQAMRTKLEQLRADKARLVEALEEAIPYMERSLEVYARQDAQAFKQLLTEMEAKP